MLAIIKPAFAQTGPEFDKSLFQLFDAQMMQTEFLQTR
jgi:hypothetical protein